MAKKKWRPTFRVTSSDGLEACKPPQIEKPRRLLPRGLVDRFMAFARFHNLVVSFWAHLSTGTQRVYIVATLLSRDYFGKNSAR